MFKNTLASAAIAVSTLIALNAPALAGDSFVDEVRVGLYDHDSDLLRDRIETSDPDVNIELLFKSPSWLQWMAQPRINLGANINTGDGTSIAYSGLVWNYDFTEALFIEGGFGGAVHNGETDIQTRDSRNYGCRVMFHENVSLGYRITPNSSVMLTMDHMSNAGLCDSNPGLTDVGVRYGYKF